jgi:hypothetical protein
MNEMEIITHVAITTKHILREMMHSHDTSIGEIIDYQFWAKSIDKFRRILKDIESLIDEMIQRLN